MKTEKLDVLVVEDDPIHAFIAQKNMEDHYNVDVATNGYAALEALEKKQYAVVLMDINLNDHTMDGIQTMRKIKYNRKHRRLKVIAVTASSDAKEWFLKEGFDGHYMKPVMKDTIVEEVNLQIGNMSKTYVKKAA